MLLQYLARESWIPTSMAFWVPSAAVLVLGVLGAHRADARGIA